MSPELIGIITTGIAIAGLILRLGSRIDRLEERMTALEGRVAKIEGLLEELGLTGRLPPPAPAGAAD